LLLTFLLQFLVEVAGTFDGFDDPVNLVVQASVAYELVDLGSQFTEFVQDGVLIVPAWAFAAFYLVLGLGFKIGQEISNRGVVDPDLSAVYVLNVKVCHLVLTTSTQLVRLPASMGVSLENATKPASPVQLDGWVCNIGLDCLNLPQLLYFA